MSIDALSWAFKLKLPSSGSKLTLLALANFCNDENEAYPSQKTLSALTCLSERAIRTHLAGLEQLGILVRTGRKRANGSFTSDLFKVRIGWVPNQPAADSAVGENFHHQRQISPNPAADSAAPDPLLTTTVTKSTPKAPARRSEQPQRNMLPQCVNSETWGKFVGMRVRINKPLTHAVIAIIFENLEKMHADGHDVNAVLEQSIVNSWAGIFTVKNAQSQRPEKFDGRKFVNTGAGGVRHEKLVS